MNCEESHSEFRELTSLFFNTAYFGPSPLRAKERALEALQREVDPSFHPYKDWWSIPDHLRDKLGQLVGVNPQTIFHSTSSSDVLNTFIESFSFKKGDKVFSLQGDYPSNVLPWMVKEKNASFKFDFLPIHRSELIEKGIQDSLFPKGTRVFNCSHVDFATGSKINLIELGKFLKEREILFIVDVTQSLGGMPISADELASIDLLTCSTYKWCLGPYGHAFGYIPDSTMKQMQVTRGNWLNAKGTEDSNSLTKYTTETLPGGRAFDRGQAPNMVQMATLEGGLDLLLEIGLENIAQYNQKLVQLFLQEQQKISDHFSLVTPLKGMGNIVCIKALKANSNELLETFKREKIDVSLREGNIRVSLNFFNTEDQVKNFFSVLTKYFI